MIDDANDGIWNSNSSGCNRGLKTEPQVRCPSLSGWNRLRDGCRWERVKTHFSEESAAKKATAELLARHPMLQIEIYYAIAKTRQRVEQITAVAHSEEAMPQR